MTADGARDGRGSSQGVLDGVKPGASRRASRGFFSLFSSKGHTQPSAPPMNPPPPKSSFRSSSSLPQRFDAVSLTSPSHRDDPAFSRDPNAHPFMVAPPRDAIRTFAPVAANPPRSAVPIVTTNFKPVATQRPFNGNVPGIRYAADCYSSPEASHSSLTLPSNDSSYSPSPVISPFSSTALLDRVSTPTVVEDEPHSRENSSASSTSDSDSIAELKRRQQEIVDAYEQGLSRGGGSTNGGFNSNNRPMSPPPEYEILAPPRPVPSRVDSAPELRHVTPPGLPHRSATAPIPASLPANPPRRTNDRRTQANDLDRIDELDESSPLGVALHHEGPFEAIASALKGPSARGNQPMPQMRPPKAPKPGHNGGSLGISPGQIFPHNFPYYQAAVQPPFRQDYNSSPQASTSYIPPQPQFGQSHSPQASTSYIPPQPQFGQPRSPQASTSYIPPHPQPGQPRYRQSNIRASFIDPERGNGGSPQASTSYIPPQPEFGQPQYGQNNMRASQVSQERVDPRWSQAYAGQPHSPAQHPHSPYDPRASYIPQTQYDPVDPPAQPQSPAHTGNPFYPGSNPPPAAGHHVAYSSENNSDAYGGIEEDLTPKRDRHSAPPVPVASQVQTEPYHAQQNGFEPRRHSVQAGFIPPADPRLFHDPARSNPGQNLSNIHHSPNGQPNGRPVAGFIDPRIFQNREQFNDGQNLSGMRHSPNGQPMTDSRLAQQQPQVAGYNQPQGSHTPPNEYDRRRPMSYQAQPTAFINRGPVPQGDPNPPMAEHDPRRRTSYQPSQPPPPGAAPADLARQQFERSQQLAALARDRPQSVAPSTATTNPLRRLPQHTPKALVMPTPLQQSSPLPGPPAAQSYPTGHYSPSSSQVRLPLQQAQPTSVTRAQTIQMVQDKDGGRHLLRKRVSVVQPSAPAHTMPPKPPPVTKQRSYMEPPPTVPEPPNPQPVKQEKKRAKRLLSKRRSDL
ncbi:hypothetical protein B0H19DRAFT_619042 [Mycena capillaripes]|nr:hypothetical protein B0H19DRAFT_619042 [Mycena capillaripes]